MRSRNKGEGENSRKRIPFLFVKRAISDSKLLVLLLGVVISSMSLFNAYFKERPLSFENLFAGQFDRFYGDIFGKDNDLLLLTTHSWEKATFPELNESIGMGVPHIANIESGFFYFPHIFVLLFPDAFRMAASHFMHSVLLFLAMYMLCIRLGASRAASLLVGLFWQFNTFNILSFGWPNIQRGMVWFVFLQGGIIAFLKEPNLKMHWV